MRNASLLQAINDAAGSDFEADANDLFAVAHRFVGFGNRDWRTDTDEYDVSLGLEGRLAKGLGYDVRIASTAAEDIKIARMGIVPEILLDL